MCFFHEPMTFEGGDYDYEIMIVENMEFMVMNFLWLSGTNDYT